MRLMAALAIFSALVALWVIWWRPWLKTKAWARGFFAWIEPIELVGWKKSESILWGRFLQFLGYGLTFAASLNGVDLTPLALVLPENLRWIVPLTPMAIALAGHIQVQLRMDTTKPIELIALPEVVPADVAQLAAKVDSANEQAVAVVQEAKKAGEV